MSYAGLRPATLAAELGTLDGPDPATMSSTEMLQTYLGHLHSGLAVSAARYAGLTRAGVLTHPIPFFGNVETATVITIGVNPSAGEFVGRDWPATITTAALACRLLRYFVDAPAPPHPWFETWSRALAVVGSSYRTAAAHVDLSPRATAAMGAVTDWKLFLDMVEEDVQWFFRLLPLCGRAKVLLAAGCVTKRWYINDFIKRVAPLRGFRLEGRPGPSGSARIGVHRLVGPGVDLPLFFCSVSPSARRKELLVQRVNEHQSTIRQWLQADS